MSRVASAWIGPLTYGGRVQVPADPADGLGGGEAVGELVGRAALVVGHVLQVDGLLQQHLPLDPRPVVSLYRVDDLGGADGRTDGRTERQTL